MPDSNTSSENEIMKNINDITSDFTCLKVSILKKASRISREVHTITIGPDATMTENMSEKSENIENEQNSCNIKAPQKSNHLQDNKISLQNGITFSVKKIFLEHEYQRKEEVQKEIERHWQHMKENGKAIKDHMAMSLSHMAKERERKSKENYAYILAEEKIAEQEEIRRRHERQLEYEESRKRMKEKEELIKKITNLRNLYRLKYCDIIALSENCGDKNSVNNVLSSYTVKLQDNQIEQIDEKLKTGEVTSTDLNAMEKMVDQIDEIILCTFKSETERINAQYEANLASMENAKQCHLQSEVLQTQKLNNTQTICEVLAPEQTSTVDILNNEAKYGGKEPQKNVQITENKTSLNIPQVIPTIINAEEIVSPNEQYENNFYDFVDKESFEMYISSQQFLENYVKSYDKLLQSASTKKFRFDCQKAINIPVNAISGINKQHLTDKYERLHNLLAGKSLPNVNQHPQGAAFCKNILAKKIVNQGETLVSSIPKMAFPIAAIVVALWNDYFDFGDLLFAHFYNACPFTVPVFLPKMADQSTEYYYKSLGYKYNEDGTLENHDQFLKRMSGIMRLYSSILISLQKKGINMNNSHGLQNAWRWLAAILNIAPWTEVADLCATLILDMLKVAGSTLWTAYPNQFHKLLIYLLEEYYPRLQSVGCIGGGPLVRLKEFLNDSLTKGSIPEPEGQLPPNFL